MLGINSLYHQDVCKYSQHSFNKQKLDCLYMKNFYCEMSEWEFSWKTLYAIVLTNNPKWVCSYLLGCGKVIFEPLATENL